MITVIADNGACLACAQNIGRFVKVRQGDE
jgi:hypothetical protein